MQYIKSDNVTVGNNKLINAFNSESDLVSKRYPFRVTNYYAGLVREQYDAIWKQCIPDALELEDVSQSPDPLEEKLLSPVPGLIHRYPDRVVLLVSNRCPVYCRFCMRKRMVGSGDAPMRGDELQIALDYIASHSEINDVILSGGDPLMLDDASLSTILIKLRAIMHIKIIRIGTRVPVTFPERITKSLCKLLKRFHPLYVNTHFNHPLEITADSSHACAMLADAGIQLGNQTVLLKGVNDSVEIMRELMKGLISIRVKPYYLHQMDLVKGTAHFRTKVSCGIDIVRGLRGHISGLAIPHYVIDLPGGKGKVAILPDDIQTKGSSIILRTYAGEQVVFNDI